MIESMVKVLRQHLNFLGVLIFCNLYSVRCLGVSRDYYRHSGCKAGIHNNPQQGTIHTYPYLR